MAMLQNDQIMVIFRGLIFFGRNTASLQGQRDESNHENIWVATKDINTATASVERTAPITRADPADESLIKLAVYFHNWHMLRKYMNNIAC